MLNITPLSPLLGGKITGLNLADGIDDAAFAAIRAAWVKHSVLVFPNQSLDTPAQVRFGSRFGDLVTTLGQYASNEPDYPQVMYVSNEKQDGKYVGALPDGEMYFHTDLCYLERPVMATMLYAIHVPSLGGNTRFASGYAAYDSLSPTRQQSLNGLRANHIFDPANQDYAGPASDRVYGASARQFSHPVAPAHPESGRRTLYVNRLMTRQIEGLSASDSRALLEELFAHQEQSAFIYEHAWTPGDLVIWDNRCTLHARTDFDANQLRKLRRVAVRGESPRDPTI
jgi:taurine dioxygenase